MCIQETKREAFDTFYIKKFFPRNLERFAYFPLAGASSGLLTILNSSIFYGTLINACSYAVTVKFFCRLDNKNFHVTNIYGPSNPAEKQGFAA